MPFSARVEEEDDAKADFHSLQAQSMSVPLQKCNQLYVAYALACQVA